MNEFFDMVVTHPRQETPEVVSLQLARPSGGPPLAAWSPGAHVEVRLPSGLIRQYSLCGTDDEAYRIAVLHESAGRGGSVELHAVAHRGQVLSIRGPRNRFELVDADDYLLLAGGIGITPILAMARQLHSGGKSWRLWYGGRSRSSMAFIDELDELDEQGTRVGIVPEDEHGLLDLPAILASATAETAIYCCGPTPMINATETCCANLSLDTNLHIERFTAAPADHPTPTEQSSSGQSSSFEVKLDRSGQLVTVDPDQTILEAVRAMLADVPSSCEDGYCGTCETTVLAGVPEHRDDYLTDDERDSNQTMMICVGRSTTPRLILDL